MLKSSSFRKGNLTDLLLDINKIALDDESDDDFPYSTTSISKSMSVSSITTNTVETPQVSEISESSKWSKLKGMLHKPKSSNKNTYNKEGSKDRPVSASIRRFIKSGFKRKEYEEETRSGLFKNLHMENRQNEIAYDCVMPFQEKIEYQLEKDLELESIDNLKLPSTIFIKEACSSVLQAENISSEHRPINRGSGVISGIWKTCSLRGDECVNETPSQLPPIACESQYVNGKSSLYGSPNQIENFPDTN